MLLYKYNNNIFSVNVMKGFVGVGVRVSGSGSGSKDQFVLNHGIRWEWVVSFTSRSICHGIVSRCNVLKRGRGGKAGLYVSEKR
jgi:hypothetical protein